MSKMRKLSSSPMCLGITYKDLKRASWPDAFRSKAGLGITYKDLKPRKTIGWDDKGKRLGITYKDLKPCLLGSLLGSSSTV